MPVAPALARRPARRGGAPLRLAGPGVPRRLVRQPPPVDRRPTARASPAGTATRRCSQGSSPASPRSGPRSRRPSTRRSPRSTPIPTGSTPCSSGRTTALAFWRTAGQELDYRRFFDINTLVSLRMEDERVFEDTHGLVLHWVREGVLDGLRVDHPDGLRDPEEYLERLHDEAPGGLDRRREDPRARRAAARRLAGRRHDRLRLPQPRRRPVRRSRRGAPADRLLRRAHRRDARLAGDGPRQEALVLGDLLAATSTGWPARSSRSASASAATATTPAASCGRRSAR